MKLHIAQRNQVKLRLGLSGASGFGKTYSALILAYGITEDWSKIAIIDTENGSASLYSHLGGYNVLTLNEPYTPERYIQAIETCELSNIEVIIIDSISHEWNGKGGCLEIHESLGGKFSDWAKVSPRHQTFIDKILNSSCHIVTTVRRKIDYSMETDMSGKSKVIKHGTKEVTREGFEYELTANFELINDKHLVKASKDRTGLFMDFPEFTILISTIPLSATQRLLTHSVRLERALIALDEIFHSHNRKQVSRPLVFNIRLDIINMFNAGRNANHVGFHA